MGRARSEDSVYSLDGSGVEWDSPGLARAHCPKVQSVVHLDHTAVLADGRALGTLPSVTQVGSVKLVVQARWVGAGGQAAVTLRENGYALSERTHKRQLHDTVKQIKEKLTWNF